MGAERQVDSATHPFHFARPPTRWIMMARQLDQRDRRIYRSFAVRRPTRTVVVVGNPYRFQSRLIRSFRERLREFSTDFAG